MGLCARSNIDNPIGLLVLEVRHMRIVMGYGLLHAEVWTVEVVISVDLVTPMNVAVTYVDGAVLGVLQSLNI